MFKTVLAGGALALLASNAFAMDGVPHNGGGSGSAAPSGDAAAIYASIQSVLIDGGQRLRDAVFGRADGTEDGAGLWVQGGHGQGRFGGSGDPTLKLSDTEGFVGIDANVGHGWRIGAVGGGGNADAKQAGGGAAVKFNGWEGALYAAGPLGPLHAMGGFGYTHDDIQARRIDSTIGPQAYHGDFGAHTTQGFASLGLPLKTGALRFEPYATGAWTNLKSQAFSETGGPPDSGQQAQMAVREAATGVGGAPAGGSSTTLTVADVDRVVQYSDVGARFSTEAGFAGGVVTPWADLAWRRAYGRLQPRADASWSGGELSSSGLPLARDASIIRAGVAARFGGWSTSLAYGGAFGARQSDQSVMLRAGLRF
jgi:outer membrane autotransporter protein